jgi:hypothetical protein
MDELKTSENKLFKKILGPKEGEVGLSEQFSQLIYIYIYTHTHTMQSSLQIHGLLVESSFSPYFHVNSTYFGHTGPASGTSMLLLV